MGLSEASPDGQSRFANEFRKMTGFSPRHYSMNVSREFGRQVTLYHTFP